MRRVQNVGHIKIGGTVRGEPAIFKKIKLTNLYKEESDNFIIYQDTKKEGYDELSVRLPFVAFPRMNFDVREMSFVKINDFEKYIAFVENGQVYLEPYQPDFQNPISELPTILLGSEDKWRDNLSLSTKAICYFVVLDEEGRELGVFDFKTMSAHTIESMKNTFDILANLPMSISTFLTMKIRIIKKIFESPKNSEVAYLDLIMPSFNEIIEVKNSNLEKIDQEDKNFRIKMEELFAK